MSKKKSHKDSVLEWFETHETITPREAYYGFGCMRLASVIARLREKGYIIATEIHTEDGEHWATYRLMKDGVEYDG